MDIFSASKRLGQAFDFDRDKLDRAFPIEAHGLIGDGASCALVRTEGTQSVARGNGGRPDRRIPRGSRGTSQTVPSTCVGGRTARRK